MAVQKKTYTYNEYAAFTRLPENVGRIFELIDGEIVEKTYHFTPSHITSQIGFYFDKYVGEHDLGYVTAADGGYIMSDDNTFIPDVGYISKEHLLHEPEREAPVPADLAVEVKSPTDSTRGLRQKAEKYLALGTRMVWLVFPDDEVIEVYVPDEDVRVVGIDGTLDGGAVLPGFTLAVRDIFPKKAADS